MGAGMGAGIRAGIGARKGAGMSRNEQGWEWEWEQGWVRGWVRGQEHGWVPGTQGHVALPSFPHPWAMLHAMAGCLPSPRSQGDAWSAFSSSTQQLEVPLAPP